MYELYITMKVHGKVTVELCERYDELDLAIRQTVAMWPENDRPVSYMIYNGDEVAASLHSFGPKGCNAVLTTSDGTSHDFTDFEYIKDDCDDKIVATKCRKDGYPTRIDHNW